MSTSLELQQQILRTEASLNDLREQLNQKNNAERFEIIASVKDSIAKFGLTAYELGFTATAKKSTTKGSKPQALGKSGSVKPKYRDPKTGTTWTGRGRMPLWMASSISGGKQKEDYLISG